MDMQRDKLFECLICEDYCLCKTCERRGTHPEHNMLCVRNNDDEVNATNECKELLCG